MRELGGPVAVEPRVQDEVMRPLDRVDAVDLHKIQRTQGLIQPRAERWFSQLVTV